MAKYWSATTTSFWDSAIVAVAQMPSDKVAITDAEYADLMSKQANGYRIVHNTSTGKPQAVAQSLTDATRTVQALDSEVVHKTGNETVGGRKTFTDRIITKHSIDDCKTVPAENQYHTALLMQDSAGQTFGHVQTASYADTGNLLVKMSVVDGVRSGEIDPGTGGETTHFIGIGMDADGIPYTHAPTPPANDDSTQIATTAWVGDNNAGSATKLKNARTIKINLASTSAASFDGSGNVTPGVSGVLPIANGGTGSSTKNFVDLTSAQTVGGTKTFSGTSIYSAADGTIRKSNANGRLILRGGTTNNDGASLYLMGKSYEDAPCTFSLLVDNGTSNAELRGEAEGSLTWNGKDIITAAGGKITGELGVGNLVLKSGNLAKSDLTSGLNICSGTAYNDSPCLSMYPMNYSDANLAGRFVLRAGANAYSLVGTKDAVLQWAGKNIVRTVNGVAADAAGNVALKAVITETWSSGTSWYRKWSDGFIEQGGVFRFTGTEAGAYIRKTGSFHKSFSNTDYTLVVTVAQNPDNSSQYSGYYIPFTEAHTTTSFAVAAIGHNSSQTITSFAWRACGY